MIFSSIVITILFTLIGYLYGKIYSKYINSLEDISCIGLGILSVFALFQIITFVGVGLDLTYHIYLFGLFFITILPLIICIIAKVNIVPNKKDLIAVVYGLVFSILLGYISSSLNTNNAFYDSTFYMSKVIESSSQLKMAHVSNYTGAQLVRLDVYYDYQGYYYFWGMILKIYRNITEYNNSLTPLYLWGASILYYFSLGMLIANSIFVLKKVKWWFWVIFPLFLLPYVTNYFNTTLGFFGNTIRMVGTSYFCLITYMLITKKDFRLYGLLFIINLFGLCVSSSALFINVLLSVSLFFYYCFKQEKDLHHYLYLILSAAPLLHYLMIIFSGWEMNLPLVAYGFLGIYILLIFIFILAIKIDKLNRCCIRLLSFLPGLVLVVLVLASIFFSRLQPYEYYFNLSSKNDMLLNYTNWIDINELIRNVGLWLMLIIAFVNIHRYAKYKLFLIIILLMFLNPLTMPTIYVVFTKDVYHRIFEIIVNPFNLAILLCSCLDIVKNRYMGVLFIGSLSLTSAYLFLNTSYSNQLKPYQEDYNYELKVSESLYDVYEYIENNIDKNNEFRPTFITQDIGLKAYIPNIYVSYGTVDYRTALENDYDENNKLQQQVNYFYPNRVYENDSPFNVVPDYQKTCEVIIDSQADYVLMKSDIATKDANGNYIFTWWNARACCDVEYENDHWVLLKVRK